MLITDVPEHLWGTLCPLCEQTIERTNAEAEDGSIQVTFTGGEFRLVHSPCLIKWLTAGKTT